MSARHGKVRGLRAMNQFSGMCQLNIDVRPLGNPRKRGQICQTIIAALPEWFGIEEYNVRYAKNAVIMEGLVATVDGDPVGLLVHKTEIDQHLEQSALNIHWLGVLPALHRKGAGSALMLATFDLARSRGLDTVTVETLDPATGYELYLRTFSFYEKHGFQVYRHFCHDPENPMVALQRRV